MAVLEVEVFADKDIGDGKFAQAKFLARLHDDILWTNDPDAAVEAIRDSIRAITGRQENP